MHNVNLLIAWGKSSSRLRSQDEAISSDVAFHPPSAFPFPIAQDEGVCQAPWVAIWFFEGVNPNSVCRSPPSSMFSWGYPKRAAESAIRNPSALLSLLSGGNPGEVIYNRRMREWLRTRQEYLVEPKDTLGFKIFLNPDDMSQTSALIATTGWLNLSVTCLFLKILKPGMNVVDAGANLGYYTLLAAKAVGNAGRVWGFEPEPRNFLLMTKSIHASSLHNVEPIQMALSDKPGNGKLYLAPSSEPNAHTLTQDRGVGSLDVPATSLDDFWSAEGAGRLDPPQGSCVRRRAHRSPRLEESLARVKTDGSYPFWIAEVERRHEPLGRPLLMV